MKTTRHLLLAGTALAVLTQLAACGKKDPTPQTEGPQSTQGKILESVQKTADEANERTRKIQESTGNQP